eukprot:10022728-Karenia_brevis.AAC.1
MQGIAATALGEPIDEDKVDCAIHVLKTATAVGIGPCPPADLRRLPKKAFRALAEILQQVEAHATRPSFLLMGKPQGGARPHSTYAHAV